MTESSVFNSTIFVSLFALNTNDFVIIPNYLPCLIRHLQGPEPNLPIVQDGCEEFVFIFGFKQIIRILLQDKSLKCTYTDRGRRPIMEEDRARPDPIDSDLL